MEILNRKARFNYTILDSFEVGIVLAGSEVKSIKAGQMSLDGSYARIRNNEVWLEAAHITPYKQASGEALPPVRSRKLLLSRLDINRLGSKLVEEGLTLLPLKVYETRGFIKVELGLGKGKKKFDKRESLKKKDADRESARAVKRPLR